MRIWVHHLLILAFVVVHMCIICSGIKKDEKLALLCFKEELQAPKDVLSSWVDGLDCCTEWEGVVCDNVTGHVIELHPTAPYFYHLKGKLSSCLLELKELRRLELSGLNGYFFSGTPIPSFIGSFANLQYLDLSYSGFQGFIPHQLGNLSSLRTLGLGFNYGLKADSLEWLYRLSSLQILELSGANLSMVHNWHEVITMLPSLRELYLSDCHLPKATHSHIYGHHNTSSSLLQVLDFSSNQFSGPLPHISTNISELDLSNNLFSGDVSHFLCHPQNSPNELKILHLGGNRLSGEIPDCWMHWPHLMVINLSKNKLVGSIPDSIEHLNELESLDLHDNMLSGNIPLSIHNCTCILKVDLGKNRFTGVIPRWLGTSLSYLRFLRLGSNNLYGKLPLELCHLTFLTILDLSHNKLFGVIPKCLKNLTSMIYEDTEVGASMEYSSIQGRFGENALVVTSMEYDNTILQLIAAMDLSSNNFTGNIPTELTNLVQLRSLNLSNNNLTGNIPSEMGNMELIESLDLSRNHLSGEIPLSFSSLSFLEVLDLSYNNLSGHIPSGTQLQGFSASCYISNNLCGPPISKGCSDDTGKIPKHDDNDDGADWFYVSMVIGFAVGLWGVGGSLFFVNSWRIAYFKFIDDKLKSFSAWARVRQT